MENWLYGAVLELDKLLAAWVTGVLSGVDFWEDLIPGIALQEPGFDIHILVNSHSRKNMHFGGVGILKI